MVILNNLIHLGLIYRGMTSMIEEHNKVVFDWWLTQVLQQEVYKIIVDDAFIEKTGELGSTEHKLLTELQSKKAFLYSRIPTSFQTGAKFLEEWHFNLIDTHVVLKKLITVTKYRPLSQCTVRFAVSEDQDQVVELARRSFSYSRFHLDSAFSNDVANMIKAEWAKNYFNGGRGNAMVVAAMQQTIIGFLLLIYGEDSLIIDLIATDKKQRRKGIARDMIMYAESQYQGFARICVGTQFTNLPSRRLYEGIGFHPIMSQYIFHYHSK